MSEEYLGDGVYAEFDGFNIILSLKAQGGERIALEPNVLQALVKYAKGLEKQFDRPGFFILEAPHG